MTACSVADFILSTYCQWLFAVGGRVKESAKLAVLEEREQ
jgi:hypothetical protein